MTALKVALVGNPNCGKSSLFNVLTGEHQHVGNYPGVTVEKRVGHGNLGAISAEITDLPGAYSLSSFSPEERIARDELLHGGFDVVVFVADSTNLKRSLVLLTNLMQLHLRLVLCLNMADEAKRAGQLLDVAHMSRLLGFSVVETAANHGQGVDELREQIVKAANSPVPQDRLVYGGRLERALEQILAALGEAEIEGFGPSSRDWIATRLLVDDQGVEFRGTTVKAAEQEAKRQRQWLEAETGMDASLYVTHRNFGFIDGMLREVTLRETRPDARAMSDRIDCVLAHHILGLPIFAFVMYALFWMTFTVGEIPMGWLESLFAWLSTKLMGLFDDPSHSLLASLLIDGVIGGVGGVLVFLPNILLLFFGLAILEDTGYLARAAYLMDRAMHRFGLHGKSFVPMLTGFGCTVPGILATRTLENERDRLTTMLVLPLMSCGARLPIWMLLVPTFFAASWRAPILFGIYAFGIALALLLALLLRRTILKGEEAPFVMELPPYRLPTLRAVFGKMTERAWMYAHKAGTVILAISILLWAAGTWPKLDRYEVDEMLESGALQLVESQEIAQADGSKVTENMVKNMKKNEALQHSALGHVGRFIEPVLKPLGLDWRVGTALLGAFGAKEVFVAQMSIMYSMGEEDSDAEHLRSAIRRDYSPAAGLSLIIFLLIATPCMATVAVTRRESGRWKWAFLQFGGLTAIAYILAFAAYHIGSKLM